LPRHRSCGAATALLTTSGFQGHSYPQDWYEDAIGELLEQVGGVDEKSISEAVRLYNDCPADVDRDSLARIGAAIATSLVDVSHEPGT